MVQPGRPCHATIEIGLNWSFWSFDITKHLHMMSEGARGAPVAPDSAVSMRATTTKDYQKVLT